MTLKSGYINDAKIKRCLAALASCEIYNDYYPGLTRLARETLTYIVRLENKVADYEEKENKS